MDSEAEHKLLFRSRCVTVLAEEEIGGTGRTPAAKTIFVL